MDVGLRGCEGDGEEYILSICMVALSFIVCNLRD